MRWIFILLVLFAPGRGAAQDQTLNFGTITRPPFSMVVDDVPTGFSIDLLTQIAAILDREVSLSRYDSFTQMLADVQNGKVDGAIANISITAEREAVMDFTQPIFESGLQIMVPFDGTSPGIWAIITRPDLLRAIIYALAGLFVGGILMWTFERRHQEYFDKPLNEALFPSFWWALNLVVNGGFEERLPRTAMGRAFATLLVVSSLFVVSIFVAKITSVMTVEAFRSSISSPSDLAGKSVGVTQGSTAQSWMTEQSVATRDYETLDGLLASFEAGELDAVVFDGPILAYYATTRGRGIGRVLPQVFRRENYGVALPADSPLREDINRAILNIRESGDYSYLTQEWFGR